MATSPVTSYPDLVALFDANAFGAPLNLGTVDWTDQASITNAVGSQMAGEDGRLWVFYADGDSGDVQPLVNPGAFVHELTGGRHSPSELDIDIRFYKIDVTQDAAFRGLVEAHRRRTRV